MEDTMSQLANEATSRGVSSKSGQAGRHHTISSGLLDHSAQATPASSNAPQQAWEVVLDPANGPGAIPASYVREVPTTPSAGQQDSTAQSRFDIVSQGLVSLETAERYFSVYHDCLDHFVYNVLADHDSLASIRAKSPILVAVICAVSALHTVSADFEVCYQVFRAEFTKQIFAKEYSFDDVRALIIGAFWLSELSWNLVGAGQSLASPFPFAILSPSLQLYV